MAPLSGKIDCFINYSFYVDNNNLAFKNVTFWKRICTMPRMRLYN